MTKGAEASDESLMLRYQRGDRTAFADLVRRHERLLFNFAMRHLRTQSLAEEVVQEAFLRVIQRSVDFKHEARFTTWIYTIVRNLCLDHLRKQAHRKGDSLDAPSKEDGPTLGEQLPDSQGCTERQVIGIELKEQIAKAVESLPEDQREVFLLREVAHLPFKEIAEITGVAENTIKSRMRYALERLQGALSDYEEYARALR